MLILQVNKFHWIKGGSETVYFGVSNLLESHGHKVIPFSMKDSRNLSTPYDKYFVENVSYSRGGVKEKIFAALKIVYSAEARKKMEALLLEVTPDIGHFHIFQHQISPSVFGPLRKRGVPIVLTLHDLKPICPNYKMLTHDGICERCKGRKFYNCFIHKCSKGSSVNSLVNTVEMYFHYAMQYYQNVDKYIAVSSFFRNKMIEYGFPSEQVVHIPNFVDISNFNFSDVDNGYGLYFGRLSEEKGLTTLLKALTIRPEIAFKIVGAGPLEQYLRRIVDREKLSNITFEGFKAGDELKKLIGHSSFTVIPSECYEAFGMTILESFSMGKPVIGARIGGIPELINEDIDGFTFEAGNVDELTEKLSLLWDDPEKRTRMGKNGREKVVKEYTPERHYKQLIAVYEKLLS